jgi:hypothetical protein
MHRPAERRSGISRSCGLLLIFRYYPAQTQRLLNDEPTQPENFQ